jgi:cell division protein FtsN
VSAQINPVQQKFTPPASTVAFNASLRTNDGILAHEVAAVFHIDYAEALKIVQDYAWWCINELHAQRNLVIDGVGELKFDHEKNILFEPDPKANFLNDSFGLTSFVSPAIRRNRAPQKQVRKAEFKDKRERNAWSKVARVAKWSVMVLPILLLIFYSMFQSGVINLSNGFSSLSPGITTNDLTQRVQAIVSEAEKVFPPTYKPLTSNDPIPSLPDTSTFKLVPSDVPSADTQLEATKNPVVEPAKSLEKPSGKAYHVIGGCFADKQKAEAFKTQLTSLGYHPMEAGTSRTGLLRISIAQYGSEPEALAGLADLKQKVDPGIWILRY